MSTFYLILKILLILYTVLFLFFAYKTKRFIKNILIFAFGGIILLLFIVFTSKYTGIVLEINPLTVGFCAIGGLPGLICLLLLPLFF